MKTILPQEAKRKGGGGPRKAWWRGRIARKLGRLDSASSSTSAAGGTSAPSTASRSPSPAARWRIGLAIALVASPALIEPQLVETGVGRFAIYADVASIEREGDVARMRALQVTEMGFKVGDVVYVGGWSRWAFDCRAKTADRLDFASLKSDGTEGPATADPAPAYAAAPGGDAAERLAIACGDERPTETLTLEQAIRRGQAALAD